jgi:hypothetical protein
MEYSKLQAWQSLETTLPFEEELSHLHCFCYHCTNNTRPIQKPTASRITSLKEKKMVGTKAFELVVKEMTKGFSGRCQVPDVYFVMEGVMIYQGRNNGRPRLKDKMTNIEAKKHFEEQRRRFVGSLAAQLTLSMLSMSEEFTTTQTSGKTTSKERESSVLAYHDGTEQLLTDALVSKYLGKRKNDPVW